ncbi:DUF3857 domain-containing protein [Flavobacterium capsici]|uniref:DUF3857 domain-containing protein n=1 Tax=Flavobacterium capsici TaxID=3075618 RepID=A0AA96EWJ0_9FLAO|nr:MULTISPECIES: DUF3857 domain-containing protein [unclassified Flavobacterium]WNM19704.1 DUF3857 domain-containing protein [Flavobacterium sp. PMR2A8]WNM21093.1 DUF3857 domain-containing protein [Flavobacterium sp. PMTSA4]
MRTKLVLLFFFAIIGLSNAQDAKEAREFFWGAKDEFKKANSIPDKWKNESAVIIHKREHYNYHKFGKSVTYISGIRKRIMLLDQAAVTEFSQFSYKNKFYTNRAYGGKKGTNYIGVKIIKPNGKEIEIDTEKEAKEVDGEKKLAIPNLEIGDIIDYYFYSVEPFKSVFDYTFEAVETPLGDVYPTMDLKITLDTENDFFINFNTYNDAPNLKEIPTKSSGERSYELTEKDIPKNEFPRWFYPLAEMPCYKFQVIFARSGKFEKLADGFLSEKERDIKKTVSKEDIFDYYNKKFVPFGDIDDIKDFLKGKTFASEDDKIREVYYFTRHQFYTRYIEAFVVNEAKMFYPFEYYGYDPIFFNTEVQFVNYFMQFLRKNDISYDVIVATPRYDGSIDDLLIQFNVKKLIRVNTKNPVYLEYFSPFSSADQFNYNIENSKAYVLEVSKGKRITDASTVQLPSSTYKENCVKTKTVMTLDDFTGFKVKKESSYLGHLKEGEQSDKLNFYDYVYEDYKKYGTKPLLDYVKNKKKNEQYTNEMNALINKMKDSQKEEFEKSLESELDFLVDDYTFKLNNTGRYGKKSAFEIEEDFAIKNNLIKKAGDKYLIELGKMLTSQIEIDQKEKDRKNNIYSIYPRSYENEIILNIPAGYSVSGLEKFNKKVENETGGFTSTAEVKGNQLIVKTYKHYKNYFEPNSNWNKMIDFLDAAYQFTQEKVLLKKN